MSASAKQLLPVYLALGPDEPKRDRVLSKMRERLAQTGMADFNIDERDMQKDQAVDDLISSLNTLPMGAAFRLVILTGCDRLTKAVSEPIVSYLHDPSPTTVLLLTADKLAKNTRLYKAIAAAGKDAIIDCSQKSARELPTYLVRMAQGMGHRLSLPAAEALIDRAGDNMRLLRNEISRLAAQLQGRPIELEDVERLVVRTAEAKPWALLDAVAARDLPRALEMLALQPERSEIRIYALVVGRIRELLVAQALDARGQGRSLAQALKVQEWQVRNHLRWARAYTTDELIAALDAAAELEQALKGSRDSQVALRLWISQTILGMHRS
ncbi:DNA polymerase III subunit delta [Collinsella sp. AGMB00827]|uniref:DNA polymerase III subunit delta n=1 Tax=Collinsella ureilytica TaxID=2869515 RepID=A0ABS7MKR8_9ACTN|nr:DNA polymerase III subunit delta [Collinsella urealyticum]MBY4797966.1 DNA polymerase III subunit delta [Collinsella urealyticum]